MCGQDRRERKIAGRHRNRKARKMRIIEAERRNPEKRDINREKGDSTMYSKKG